MTKGELLKELEGLDDDCEVKISNGFEAWSIKNIEAVIDITIYGEEE